ncbi:MAG TPA: tRNA 2-selenouridine(34) synthase MnmH [Ohtaekwangia sp.]|nr:tRNA 2-selenouridine(34) synthase MnmH [Ohtaekwangia sp.]
MIVDIEQFLRLREELPVVDVRSEGEFNAGHIKGARNIPLLNDRERVEVGTDYKKKGQLEAIKTGFRLVGPRLPEIIEAAENTGKELLVHCWRGGMRSGNFCQFLSMARIKTRQLEGGYRAYRHLALKSFEAPLNLIVITGYTGSGKSDVLRALGEKGEQIIDLEQLAHHKGSAFGGLMMPPQPTTEQFQNNLFETIRTLDFGKRIWIEDESLAIGKVFLPDVLWRRMTASPLVELVVEREVRIQRLVQEYGHANPEEFLKAMTRIIKKLGGQHFQAAREKLLQGDMTATIDILLNYYDKTYLHALNRKAAPRVAWRGDGGKAGVVAEELLTLWRNE